MIVYHGTTYRRARRIAEGGFLPKKPSRRVWFAQSKSYADGRARTQARRAHDRPIVLTCDLDLNALRQRLGSKRIFHRNRVIAVDAPVPADVLLSDPVVDSPSTPKELADWINHVLGVRPYKGARPSHPGIVRLSRWVANRRASRPASKIQPAELLQVARGWLPDLFKDVQIDWDRARAYPKVPVYPARVEMAAVEPDPREARAFELLEDASARRRGRGLKLLAELGDPDLFDWCTMYLDDDSPSVRVTALRLIARCEDGEAEVIAPLAASGDKRVRGAAIAALARHAGRDAPAWFERGLKDPSACVRVETAAQLELLDPDRHRELFELALYDPNPDVVRRAKKLVAHKGYAKRKW